MSIRFGVTAGQLTAYMAKIGVYKVEQTYTVSIKSRFILTQTAVKKALGIGYEVSSVELAKDVSNLAITNVDSAAIAILNTGYRALARSYHPDLGGDIEVMKLLNQSKKELIDLIESLKG